MNLSLTTILNVFPHVFKNEFNERKPLLYANGNAISRYRIDKTFVLTKDKDGKKELYEFFYMEGKGYCYSEVMEGLFPDLIHSIINNRAEEKALRYKALVEQINKQYPFQKEAYICSKLWAKRGSETSMDDIMLALKEVMYQRKIKGNA